mmetsp:Transcript_43591/g.104719  ORF Transcript_43591/g.104719 Transcript_43591/m.104719 type:complete len:233 (+) Transcript_43591:40-738(+)
MMPAARRCSALTTSSHLACVVPKLCAFHARCIVEAASQRRSCCSFSFISPKYLSFSSSWTCSERFVAITASARVRKMPWMRLAMTACSPCALCRRRSAARPRPASPLTAACSFNTPRLSRRSSRSAIRRSRVASQACRQSLPRALAWRRMAAALRRALRRARLSLRRCSSAAAFALTILICSRRCSTNTATRSRLALAASSPSVISSSVFLRGGIGLMKPCVNLFRRASTGT